ncbi:MAG: bifunctional nuclease family protein [Lachnoclostridium sp.]|nr:bifunctional nuclease family protein [Lachnoclostridium sp.]
MENRIRLKILGISYSQIQQGAYALILAQVNGPYRIPVVIGPAEAQSIALIIEGLKAPRPMTHDLFVALAHAYGVKLREAFIYKFEDGIFSCELTFDDGERVVKLDSRTSDAIAIAIRTGAPVYTTREILDETGFIMEIREENPDNEDGDDDDEDAEDDGFIGDCPDDYEDPDDYVAGEPKLENYAIEELERTLERLIRNEEYEEAARVKEILERKRRESNTD